MGTLSLSVSFSVAFSRSFSLSSLCLYLSLCSSRYWGWPPGRIPGIRGSRESRLARVLPPLSLCLSLSRLCWPWWGLYGAKWNAHLRPRLSQVGPMWSMLGTSRAQVEPTLGLGWPMLGLCWPRLGVCWRMLAPCWHTLALCWAILEATLGICWLCWGDFRQFMFKNIFRYNFLRFFLPAKQKPWKSLRFLTSPRWNSRPPRGQKPCKTQCFAYLTHTKHCKLHINLSTGFNLRSTRGRAEVDQKGRRQGARAYITFGYQPKASGKDTGPWPAPGLWGTIFPSRKAKTMEKPTFFNISKMKFSAAEGPKTL